MTDFSLQWSKSCPSGRLFLLRCLGLGPAGLGRPADCGLGGGLQALLRKAQQRGYEFVVSGCDWGGSDYIPAQHIKISTTVHVIMGALPTGKLDILHIRRYSGMNYDDIVADIMRNHTAYNGRAIATDFGVGAVYNSKIRENFPAGSSE